MSELSHSQNYQSLCLAVKSAYFIMFDSPKTSRGRHKIPAQEMLSIGSLARQPHKSSKCYRAALSSMPVPGLPLRTAIIICSAKCPPPVRSECSERHAKNSHMLRTENAKPSSDRPGIKKVVGTQKTALCARPSRSEAQLLFGARFAQLYSYHRAETIIIRYCLLSSSLSSSRNIILRLFKDAAERRSSSQVLPSVTGRVRGGSPTWAGV